MASSGNPETRRKILDAAWGTLEEAAGAEVRMSDIARRAGVSRQALYLHFPTRAELLAAVTRHIDGVKGVDARLAASRSAKTGEERLAAFIEAWGNYIPEVYGVARALIQMMESDDAACEAWRDRCAAIRQGCRAAIDALSADGRLTKDYSPEEATDLLWTLLSVGGWEMLTRDCGWPQEKYVRTMQQVARRVLVANS